MIINKSKLYFLFYKVILVLFFITTNLHFFSSIPFGKIKYLYYFFLFVSLILFMGSYLLISVDSYRIKVSLCLIALIIYGYCFKDYSILYAMLYCLLLSVFNIKSIIKLTFIANLVTFILLSLLSLFGILPLFYDNGKSGTTIYSGLLLGFSFKNTTGYFLLFLILTLGIFSIKKIYVLILTFISVYFEFILIKDKTAAIILAVFFVVYLFDRQKEVSNTLDKILKYIPVLLAIISLVLVRLWNNGSNLINQINELLSGRIYIWNMEWTLHKPKIWPQAIGIGNFFDMNIKIPLDGFFALSPLQDGILYYIFVIVILILAIHKLSIRRDSHILTSFIFLVVCGFTEMIPLSSISWLLPISFGLLFKEESY